MFRWITGLSVKLIQSYLPSPFIFCILLTLIAYIAGIAFTGQSIVQMANYWGNGLWSLLGFSMQMALVLVCGYALARAPLVNHFLDKLAASITSPKIAIFMVTIIALIACWINWGFGLIVGAVFAKALARQVKGVDYPLLVASAYSGFLIWHGGFSGSIPLALASGGDKLVQISGHTINTAIPVSQTLFAPYNLVIILGLFIGLPLVNFFMLPKQATVVDPKLMDNSLPPKPERNTLAQRIDDHHIFAILLIILAIIWLFSHFSNKGFLLDLNIVIGLFLFIGLLAHGTPQRYMNAIEDSIRGVSGIVLLFPFYGGIMGMMMGVNAEGTSLSTLITQSFIDLSSKESFPVLSFLSAGLVNIFVPSGGGQWAVQGPIMLPAGVQLGVEPVKTAMAIAWGDAWTNMIQPFWALPLLGIAGLDARAIMGYCLITLIYAGILIGSVFYFMV